jgi:hypothetical protein
MTYDNRHGGPYDRGGADFWYGRPIELADMTPDEITAYSAGYRDAEERGDQKDWGDAS